MSTIKDIARETGLGLATISSYLNGGNVRPQNKILIQEAIEKLDYQRNDIARSLKTAKTNTIGVIIPQIDDAYFSKVVATISSSLYEHEYSMLVMDFGLDIKREKQAVEFLCSKQVSGIIDMPSNLTTRHLDRAMNQKVPIVLFDRAMPSKDLPVVKSDNFLAIDLAVDHLVRNGHRHIGFISGNQKIETAREREAAYYKALEKRGIKKKTSYVHRCDYVQQDSAAESAHKIIESNPEITALIASNMITMMGALQAFNEMDLRIPDEMSFVGFDDVRFAKAYNPQLTIIEQPIETIARQSVDILLREIEHKEKQEDLIKIYEPRLVEGKSVKKF